MPSRLSSLPLLAEAERMRLGEFLATGALDTLFTLSKEANGLNDLPETIQLHCAGTWTRTVCQMTHADPQSNNRLKLPIAACSVRNSRLAFAASNV